MGFIAFARNAGIRRKTDVGQSRLMEYIYFFYFV